MVITDSEVRLCKNVETLGVESAKDFLKKSQEAIEARGVFNVALSGGNTPKALFKVLTSEDFIHQIDWKHIRFFFGDERYVSHEDEKSNFRMAFENLFSLIPIHRSQIFPVPTENASPYDAAAAYDRTLKEELGEELVLDLVYLGMGEEGHTASLFPGTDIVEACVHQKGSVGQEVVATFVEKVKMFRITFVPQLINQARSVVFLVAGEEKATKLKQVLRGPYEPGDCPAQLIQPTKNKRLFFLDEKAAKAL